MHETLFKFYFAPVNFFCLNFWPHLQCEQNWIFWIFDLGKICVDLKFIGSADKFSERQRLFHDVPTKTGSRHLGGNGNERILRKQPDLSIFQTTVRI